ncbi:MAG: LLM class F420-dependent oxidoreductase [Deltaproteobacteria bacterium RBG_13_65_10]|jgi:F420-dependent oxidoreductase-like protein|nr:MAG: LLM class F420-dependent oxidoreductase [Deltaproteobacteria bacterium RBG_13_65_10]
MRIGIGIAADGASLEATLEEYVRAEKDGFTAAWTPNIFAFDALTLIALAGGLTSRIELGTAVVPTFPRHPFALAQQAMTVQAATQGRLALGLGPSHRVVIETMLGLSYEKPARHMREYLSVLCALRDNAQVSFEGETYRVQGNLKVSGCSPFPVLVGALGPAMLKVAGQLADGTVTWMTGARVLEKTIVPTITRHAREAGRAAPRVVAGIPVCVTDDADGARETAAKLFAIYGTLPSYRAMLDAEGAAGPADIAIIGDEKQVKASLSRLASAGVTDLQGSIFPSGQDRAASRARTYALLASLGGDIG